MRLIDIVKQDPKKWVLHMLSSNPNITMQDIIDNPALKWNWYSVSYNPNVTWEFVTEHIDKDWDWEGLSTVIHIDIIGMSENINYPWDWNGISSNPTLTDAFVIQNFGKEWNWGVLVTKMPLDFIEMHELFLRDKLDYDELTFDYYFSFNPHVDLDYLLSLPDIDWDWENFCDNGKINIKDIVNNPNEPWVWELLSKRIDIHDILKNKNLHWDWDAISRKNTSVTMKIVKEHPDLFFHDLLQENSGISMNDIEQNIEYFELLHYYYISQNDRLTIDFYNRHKDHFERYYSELSKNLWNLQMTKQRKELLDQTIALSSLHILPPYVVEHLTSYTIPAIELYEKMQIINSVMKKNPL